MKKYVIAGIGLLFILFLVMQLRGLSLGNPWLDGEWDDVSRGDLIIPVVANGTVEADKLIEIKSKASGEVIRINVVEGQMVNEGDVLIELDPVDERRNLQRAQEELDRASSNLAKARIVREDQKLTLPLSTRRAKATVEDLRAQLENAEYDYNKVDRLYKREPPVASEQEWIRHKAAYERLQANYEQAHIDYERAKVNEDTNLAAAEQDVKLAEATLRAANIAVEDAEERLSETTVVARQPGMVYSVRVREGEVIQSGMTSLTGGTVLMFLADTSKMVVFAQVDEADIGLVRRIAPDYAQPGRIRRLTRQELLDLRDDPDAADSEAANLRGQRVRITVDAYRDEEYEGIIERILPEPRRLSNVITFDVRIVLLGENVDKLLGLQADVEFTADRVRDALRVKNEAIHSEGKETYVFVPIQKTGSKRWDEKKVRVKIGMTDGIYTEIRSGLAEDIQRVWVRRPQKTEREREAEEYSG
jgi:HlyD family secretion protein